MLVMAGPDPARPPVAFTPIEFLFPPGPHFKTYDLKVTQFHPECNVPCTEPGLADRLKAAAVQVFTGVHGRGLRPDGLPCRRGRTGLLPRSQLHLLGVLPAGVPGLCRLHPRLRRDRTGRLPARHHRRRAAHAMRAASSAYAVRPSRDGFAMFAARDLARGSVVFEGEGRAQRIVTRSHVDRTWSEADREVFYRYAYPISSEVFVLWDTEPAGLGAAEPLVRSQHGVHRPQPGGAARHPRRRGTDGRLRDLLRPPHDALRLRVRQPALPGRVEGGKGLFG